MSALFVVAAVVVTCLTVGWFITARRVPENAASHERLRQEETSRSDDLYAGSDRPAGPDAEVTDPETLGGDQSPPR